MVPLKRIWAKNIGPFFTAIDNILDGIFVFERSMFKSEKKFKRVSAVYSFYKRWILKFIERIGDHHLFLNAGGLAFSLFLCIIPLTLIMFFFLGNFLSSTEFVGRINTFIDTLIPYEDYAAFAKELIGGRINELVEYRNVAGIIGFSALLFAASGFIASIRTVLHLVFDVCDLFCNFHDYSDSGSSAKGCLKNADTGDC